MNRFDVALCGFFISAFFAAIGLGIKLNMDASELHERLVWEGEHCSYQPTGRMIEVTRGGQCINQMSTGGMLGMCAMRAPVSTAIEQEMIKVCPDRK